MEIKMGSNYILHVEKSLLHPDELFFFYQTKEGAEAEKAHDEQPFGRPTLEEAIRKGVEKMRKERRK